MLWRSVRTARHAPVSGRGVLFRYGSKTHYRRCLPGARALKRGMPLPRNAARIVKIAAGIVMRRTKRKARRRLKTQLPSRTIAATRKSLTKVHKAATDRVNSLLDSIGV